MDSLLKYHKLKLIEARHKRLIRNEFPDGLLPWVATQGDFHFVTIDTNVDKKTGIEEPLLINAAGSYEGGVMEREVELKNYGEVIFERYVKNDDPSTGSNVLNFYIDDVLKLSIKGPTPWRRTEPIGVTPGKHRFKFEYIVNGKPNGRSATIDTFEVWEGRSLKTTIAKYNPPKPVKGLAQTKTLRGYTRVQEMHLSDTEIRFSAMFDGPSFLEFMAINDRIFYFVDEFGVCYRGTFPESVEPKSEALNALYYVDLTMRCPQKVGIGFV